MLQMLVIEPKVAILDEVDSGLDVDSLKIVGNAVKYLTKKTKMSVIVITHYARILKHIKPGYVHVLMNGKIVKSGGKNLAAQVEKNGYKDL